MDIDGTAHSTPPDDSAPCVAERETIAYFAGELSAADAERAERHVAECAACQETLATMTRFTAPDLTESEEQLLDAVAARTAEAARALGPTEDAAAPAPVPLRPKRPRWFAPVALAAGLALASVAGLAVWRAAQERDSTLERGVAALRSATKERRPLELRLSGLDYAPYEGARGGQGRDADLLAASVQFLEAEVERRPTAESHHALGRALVASRDYAGAVRQLERAHEASPSDAQILSDLGVARAAAGDAAAGLLDVNHALTIDPNLSEALFNRAVLRANAGLAEDARGDFERVAELDPASPWAGEARSRLADLPNR